MSETSGSSANMSRVQRLDPCSAREWLAFIQDHPDAKIFHSPAWLSLLRDVYGFDVFALCVVENSRIVCGMPFMDVRSSLTGHRWVSLPFTDYCSPLVALGCDEQFSSLVKYLRECAGNTVPRIEIRWHIPEVSPVPRSTSFVRHYIPLSADADSVYDKFRPRVRRSIKMGRQEGITVRQCSTAKEFLEFYKLLVLTRARLGAPTQPRRFFESVWTYLLEQGHGFALLAYLDARPIAGAVYLTHGTSVADKYAASDPKFSRLHANHLIVWEALRRSCAAGFSLLDFGRTDCDNQGLRLFKNGWGAQEEILTYTHLPPASTPKSSHKSHRLVEAVIRRSPSFVSRIIGEMLYRHFA
jgi:CelD/BcsL family acetyltransferase involved in cellulose biosynthesis